MTCVLSRSSFYLTLAALVTIGLGPQLVPAANAAPKTRPADDDHPGAPAVSVNQVALIDMVRAFNECRETKFLQAELLKQKDAFEKEAAERVKRIDELKARRDALKAQDPGWAAADEQVRREADAYSNWVAEVRKKTTRYQCHLMIDLYKEIEGAAAAVAAQKGVRMVVSHNEPAPVPDLDKTDANQVRNALLSRHLIYTDPALKVNSLDITDDVIAYLDSNSSNSSNSGPKESNEPGTSSAKDKEKDSEKDSKPKDDQQ